jgi:hypothetical protein
MAICSHQSKLGIYTPVSRRSIPWDPEVKDLFNLTRRGGRQRFFRVFSSRPHWKPGSRAQRVLSKMYSAVC